jgi:hypothetical protein
MNGWKILDQRMPTPRTLFGMVSVNNNLIYTIGGLSAHAKDKNDNNRRNVHYDTANVDIFNTEKKKWRKGPTLNHPRSGLGVVAVSDFTNDERLFAIGGMAGNPSEASFFAVPYVEMLNLNVKKDDEAWVKLPDLPANRTEIAVVFCLGRIYVIGGAGATISSATDSMWSMNVMKTDSKGNSILLSTEEQVKETWRKETPIPTLRAALTAEVINDQIIVVGGMRGFLATNLDPDPLKTVDVYDPSTKKWKITDDSNAPMHLPTARHSPASVVVPSTLLVNNKNDNSVHVKGITTSMLVISGGYGTNGDLKSTVGMVEGNGAWAKLPELSVARMGLRMSYVGHRQRGCVYAMGGMTLESTQHDIIGSSSPITGVVEELCHGAVFTKEQEL